MKGKDMEDNGQHTEDNGKRTFCLKCNKELPLSKSKPYKYCSDRCRKAYKKDNGQITDNGNGIDNGIKITDNGQVKDNGKISSEVKERLHTMAMQDGLSIKDFAEKLINNEWLIRHSKLIDDGISQLLE